MYFKPFGLLAPHDLNLIRRELVRLSFGETEQTLRSMIDKKVLGLSPDQRQVRLTDYGLELYRASESAQQEWESSPIITTSNLDQDEIIIRAGETFKANRLLREIFARARTELCVLDPYLGSIVFDLAEDFVRCGRVRAITSERMKRSTLPAYKAFLTQYPATVELRTLDVERIHDRFILWDGTHGIHLGHSIKDLGKKD